jgi:hypothetical protein
MNIRDLRPLVIAALGLLLSGIAAPARGDVTAAARAFSEGQAAQLAGNYELAAQNFELANSLIASREALRSAARARLLANQLSRAATHAEALLARYGDDPGSNKLASDILKDARPRLGRVKVTCAAPCSLAVDGRALVVAHAETHLFYLNPGRQLLEAAFEGGQSRSRPIAPRAGEDLEVRLEPPPAPKPVAAAPARAGTATGAAGAERRRGLPRAVFVIGAGATVALGGLAIWSGLDTVSAHDDYTANPTPQGWDDGRQKQLRTNLLIGGTVAAGVGTALIGIFWTNWHPGSPTVALSPTPADGFTIAVSGRF